MEILTRNCKSCKMLEEPEVKLFQNVMWLIRFCYGSLAKLCPTPCDPMDYSTLEHPVLPFLLEFAQIHVHCISDIL